MLKILLSKSTINKESLSIKFNKCKLLAVIALITTPFTLLRISYFGIPEISLFVLAIFIDFSKINPISKIKLKICYIRFLIIFILISTIGFIINWMIFPFLGLAHTSTIDDVIFNYSAIIFAFFGVLVYAQFIKLLHGSQLISLVSYSFYSFSITIISLYLLSLFKNSVLGYPLLYYSYFAPFASNLHHVSMVLLPFSFLGIYLTSIEKKKMLKYVCLIMSIVLMYLSVQTGSTKALLGILAGLSITVFYFLTTKDGVLNKKQKYYIVFLVLVLLVYVPLYFVEIYDYAVKFFIDNDLKEGRSMLYLDAIKLSESSLLFGRGPGAHISGLDGRFYDSHSTILGILLQAGLIGLVFYIIMWVKLINILKYNGYLLASLITMLIYSIGGDTLRRLPIWLLIALLVNLVEFERNKFKME